ncbi:hypothetical protein QBC34DRAFT_439167 [Podospora aff. communis PSN243]|uniref:Uncharacterized protein n=1 Tax=Podospora aff. communis PSN243 TaxID=3040156 RepID=A0AAV9GJZ9_9PEZI|nr:hypothetical protein QBC34DRAFT_439167 [Podospora aff. communis PSN243]
METQIQLLPKTMLPSKPISPQPNSPLLHLPGELRNQIYAHLLGHHKTISVYRIPPPSSGPLTTIPKPSSCQPLLSRLLPLFLSCRLLSLEARTWFYSQNAFFFPTPSSLDWPTRRNLNSLCRTFLDVIGERNTVLIQHLCVPFPLEDPDAFDRWYEAPAELVEGRMLFPGLAARVPGLRVLEFVTSRIPGAGGMALEGHLGRYERGERRGLVGRIDEALSEEFPGLERVVVDVEGEGTEVEGWEGWETRREGEVEETRWKVFSTLGRERDVVEEEPVVLVKLPRRTRWKWNVMRGLGIEVSESEMRKFFDDWRPLGDGRV